VVIVYLVLIKTWKMIVPHAFCFSFAQDNKAAFKFRRSDFFGDSF